MWGSPTTTEGKFESLEGEFLEVMPGTVGALDIQSDSNFYLTAGWAGWGLKILLSSALYHHTIRSFRRTLLSQIVSDTNTALFLNQRPEKKHSGELQQLD